MLADVPRAVDVLVLGSEPEAIVAAVAAARDGARTVLATADARLGGLFVLGALNVLDLRTEPRDFQEGLFADWWARVGGGTAFDVARAEAAFAAMLREAGVTVVRAHAEPVVVDDRVAGARLRPVDEAGAADGAIEVRAAHTIDGTADADHAAAAGATASFGWRSFGLDARMADTLVFRIEGLDWGRLQAALEARGPSFARTDDRVAWGHFGGIPAAYEPVEPGLRLRGLNVGRQDDGSVLINALLVYGIDPFDAASRSEGRARATREAPRIVAYLAERIPGFASARFGGVADRLYVRETRHLETRCTLTVDDLFDHRVTPADVAAGGYPMDVQTMTPADDGYVYGVPAIYGGRLCMHVPTAVDGVWVVGRSAGFDPIAHSSARVVPFGMALAEAVGVAAAHGAAVGRGPADVGTSSGDIATVRRRLAALGAYLPPVADRAPLGPAAHPHYAAYRTLLRRGLALGGYSNDPALDAAMPALGHLYLLANVGQRFAGSAGLGAALLAAVGTPSGDLTVELALRLQVAAACALGVCPDDASLAGLVTVDLVPRDLARRLEADPAEPKRLRRGMRDRLSGTPTWLL